MQTVIIDASGHNVFAATIAARQLERESALEIATIEREATYLSHITAPFQRQSAIDQIAAATAARRRLARRQHA